MEIQVDHESGVPIYTQIMEQIKHLVATGRLKPGDQLPTIRQLAVELRVNPIPWFMPITNWIVKG